MTTTTYPHGTTLARTTPGYDMTLTRRGLLVGRAHIRNTGRGRWVADVFAYDGYTWTLDRRTQPATLAETRAAIHEYAAAYDRFAYVASGDCHSGGPGYPGPCPEGMDWSRWLAMNNVD